MNFYHNNPYEKQLPLNTYLQTEENKNSLKNMLNWLASIIIGQSLMAYILVFGITIIVIVSSLLGDGFSFFSQISNFLNLMLNEISTGSDSVLSSFINMLLYIAMIITPFLIYILIRKIKIKNIISFNKPVWNISSLSLIPIAMIAGLLGSIISGILLTILNFFEIAPGELPIHIGTSAIGLLVSILETAILPAFIEEFAYRGIIMGSLRKFGDWFAIFASAFLFSAMHGTLQQIPGTFFIGIIIGYLVVKTGSIWYGVLAHFVNNFIYVLEEYFVNILAPYGLENISLVFFNFLVYGIAILALIHIIHKGEFLSDFKSMFKKAQKENVMIKTFFLSPAVIVLIIVTTIQVALTLFI